MQNTLNNFYDCDLCQTSLVHIYICTYIHFTILEHTACKIVITRVLHNDMYLCHRQHATDEKAREGVVMVRKPYAHLDKIVLTRRLLSLLAVLSLIRHFCCAQLNISNFASPLLFFFGRWAAQPVGTYARRFDPSVLAFSLNLYVFSLALALPVVHNKSIRKVSSEPQTPFITFTHIVNFVDRSVSDFRLDFLPDTHGPDDSDTRNQCSPMVPEQMCSHGSDTPTLRELSPTERVLRVPSQSY